MKNIQLALDGGDEKAMRELKQQTPGLTHKKIYLAGLEELMELKNKKEKSL